MEYAQLHMKSATTALNVFLEREYRSFKSLFYINNTANIKMLTTLRERFENNGNIPTLNSNTTLFKCSQESNKQKPKPKV